MTLFLLFRGECAKPTCDEADVKSAGGLSQLNQNEDDPFERPEDDAVMTSTSVFVAQPGSEQAGNINMIYFVVSITVSRIGLIGCLSN